MSELISNIATNVITGFLGVGKTTAILNWLKNKPHNERWSVLVNEAGQVGVDGMVLENAGIVVKQVPGGCMCCASGLPMQVAINQLLIATRPHRLLIEPSGMGHPGNILNTLASKEYKGVIDLRACLCLIDPRHLSKQQYLNSDLFIDQIAVADVLVANKIDRCEASDRQRFTEFVSSLDTRLQASGWVTQGKLDPVWMELIHQPLNQLVGNRKNNGNTSILLSISVPIENTVVHDTLKLTCFIDNLKVDRLKAIINTDQGVVFINHVNGETSISPLEAIESYHIEIISSRKIDEESISAGLNQCRIIS